MYWEYDGTQLKSMILGYQENGHIAMEQKDSKTGEVEEREQKMMYLEIGIHSLSLAKILICAKKRDNSFEYKNNN